MQPPKLQTQVSPSLRCQTLPAVSNILTTDIHAERNHQGKGNMLLFPRENRQREGPAHCRERLGGLLRYYHRQAA